MKIMVKDHFESQVLEPNQNPSKDQVEDKCETTETKEPEKEI